MTSQEVLKPIQKADDIISEIITRTEKSLLDNEEYQTLTKNKKDFRSVRIYGDSKNPLFIMTHVYDYLYPAKKGKHIERFAKLFLPDIEIVKRKARIFQNKPNSDEIFHIDRSVNMITKKGLMRAMYLNDTPLTITFRDFMMELLDELYQNNRAIVEQALDKAQLTITKQQERIGTLEEANFYNKTIAAKLNHLDGFISSEEMLSESERKELSMLRTLHMRPHQVYIVDDAYVRNAHVKKSITKKPNAKKPAAKTPRKRGQYLPTSLLEDSEEESDTSDASDDRKTQRLSDGVEYDMPFQCYNKTSLEQDYAGDNMYYYFPAYQTGDKELKNKNYHSVFAMDIYNNIHYKKMLERLNTTEAQTPLKNVYMVSYNDIMNARTRAFIHDNFVNLFSDLKGVEYKSF